MDFDIIDRDVLIIRAKRLFMDWVQSTPDGDQISDEVLSQTNVYLMPELDKPSTWEKFLKMNFHLIFEDQLGGWYTDESLWPQNRTYKMFLEWFDVTYTDIVQDLVEGPIIKD